MIARNRCPGCGLRLGCRVKETVGELYRCRKCKTVLLHAERDTRAMESLFIAKPDGAAGGRDLLTIPRV